MNEHQNGPPESEGGAPQSPAVNAEGHPTANIVDASRSGRARRFKRPAAPKPLPRICPNDIPGQLRARRDAANRSVPLYCGCRDPWVCDCYRTDPPLTGHQLDGWRDAALKVLSGGQVPLLPIEVRRALWKRGGPDRVLAEKLHEACGGEVA